MIREITLRHYGGSLGTTLPKAMTDSLNLGAGDKAFAVETENGILLTPYDPEFARVMEAEESTGAGGRSGDAGGRGG